ncbi:MAG: S-formylglutathione hydrolase [Halieaceae bacterium]
MEKVAANRCCWGSQERYRHHSDVLDCDMHFSIYLPPQISERKVPLLYWLSGLTCTDENFVTKAGAQRYAAEHGIAIVAPDTSPRGERVPDDPDEAWDFGKGAGFYINATQEPWSANYRMYDYIVDELPALVQKNFAVDSKNVSIFGHSMGGHGALTIALKNPDRFRSVSAFSPIVSPSTVPWGQKAFSHYLGDDKASWAEHDCCELVRQGGRQLPMMVDQGLDDDFLEEQLQTSLLEQACEAVDYRATIRMQPGYDHSYFFIASFMGDHIAFHSQALGNYNRM